MVYVYHKCAGRDPFVTKFFLDFFMLYGVTHV